MLETVATPADPVGKRLLARPEFSRDYRRTGARPPRAPRRLSEMMASEDRTAPANLETTPASPPGHDASRYAVRSDGLRPGDGEPEDASVFSTKRRSTGLGLPGRATHRGPESPDLDHQGKLSEVGSGP